MSIQHNPADIPNPNFTMIDEKDKEIQSLRQELDRVKAACAVKDEALRIIAEALRIIAGDGFDAHDGKFDDKCMGDSCVAKRALGADGSDILKKLADAEKVVEDEKAKSKRLAEALRFYGFHHIPCDFAGPPSAYFTATAKCTCGYSEALREHEAGL